MKRFSILIAILALVLASLACQAVTGGGGGGDNGTAPTSTSNDPEVLPVEPDGGAGGSTTTDTGFPMTSDAFNVTDIGDGSLLYYTRLSADDVLKFYRNTYTAKGYKEREILTVIAEGTFSIVFDGDASGKAVVIQSVDLGDGSRTISIRLEDV